VNLVTGARSTDELAAALTALSNRVFVVLDAHVFIVHAHRDPASLPGALTDLGVEVLLGASHRGRFPPVLSVLN